MNVRASDADRDATVNRLREAAGEGQLTLEELTDRIEAAVNAVMRSDLVPLTCDLPTAGAVGVATLPRRSVGWGTSSARGRGLCRPRTRSAHGWATSSSICARHKSAQRRPTFTPVRCSATSSCSSRKASRSRCKPARGWAEPTCKPTPGPRGSAHRAHRRDVLRQHQRPPPAGCGRSRGRRGSAPSSPRRGFRRSPSHTESSRAQSAPKRVRSSAASGTHLADRSDRAAAKRGDHLVHAKANCHACLRGGTGRLCLPRRSAPLVSVNSRSSG